MQGILARPKQDLRYRRSSVFSERSAMEVSCTLQCTFSSYWNQQGSVRLKKERSLCFIHILRSQFFYPLKLCIHCYSILLTPNIRQTNARLKNISHKTNGVMKSALNSYLRTSVVNKDSSGCEQVWRWAVAPLGTRVPRLQSPSVAGNW